MHTPVDCFCKQTSELTVYKLSATLSGKEKALLHYTVRPAVPQILGTHKQSLREEYNQVADVSFGFPLLLDSNSCFIFSQLPFDYVLLRNELEHNNLSCSTSTVH